MIIGWANNVNQRILDSTSITHGEGGYVEDSDMSGLKNRRLTSYIVPDVYNVTMDFNWEEKDSNGESEYDRFLKWFNYAHRRGVNPFEFPSIRKFSITGSKEMARYKITSSLNASKSGFCMRVTMTWEEVYNGFIEIPADDYSVDHMVFYNGKIEIYFRNRPMSIPVLDGFSVEAKVHGGDEVVANTNVYKIVQEVDNVTLYYVPILENGIYDITCKFNHIPYSYTLGVNNG